MKTFSHHQGSGFGLGLVLAAMLLWSNALGGPVRILQQVKDQYPAAKTGGNYMFNFYLPPRGNSTPWWPAWSPDGQSIVFSLHGSIWRMNIERDGLDIWPDGTAFELVSSSEYVSSPAWSPDGRYLVFTSDDGQAINLKLLDTENGAIIALTEGSHLNLDPAWSPQGDRLSFVSTRPNGYFNIEILEIREGKPGQRFPVTRDNDFGRPRLYFSPIDLNIEPTWSPDGTELIFISNRGIPLGSGAIWRMPARENGIDEARIIHKEETLYRTRPDWSADGTRIVYSSHLGGQFNNLFVLPVEGGEPYKLTFGEWDAFHPRWSPDGQWILYVSNHEGLPQMRLLRTFGGDEHAVPIRSLRWKRPAGGLRVRTVEANTGEEIAARVYLRGSDGKAYAPADAYHRVGRLGEEFFHSSGQFTVNLPAGPASLELMHGFEYLPESHQVEISPGRVTEVVVRLRRLADPQAKGWYSGSNHVHMNYAGNLHNTPENLIMMAEAENLNMIGEQVANKDNRILDYQFFTGRLHPLSDEKHLLYFNQEYRPPFYGHVSLMNLTENLISPLTTGYEGTAIESLYPSNTDIFRLARRQGAIGAYVHPFGGNSDPLEGNLGTAKAFPVDLALGTVDYHELVSTAGWAAYAVWHHALNNGFRIPAVGGEDSISSLHSTAIVGQVRSYCFLGPRLTWEGWINAVKQGHCTVTNGPILELWVDDRMPGETVRLAQPGSVIVRGRIDSLVPLDNAELVIGGERIVLPGVASAWREGEGLHYEFQREIPVDRSRWMTLQAHHSKPVHPLDDDFPQATTNPVWVLIGDEPVRSSESARYFIRWIEKLTSMAESHPGWRSEAEKAHVLGQFKEAGERFLALEKEALSLGR